MNDSEENQNGNEGDKLTGILNLGEAVEEDSETEKLETLGEGNSDYRINPSLGVVRKDGKYTFTIDKDGGIDSVLNVDWKLDSYASATLSTYSNYENRCYSATVTMTQCGENKLSAQINGGDNIEANVICTDSNADFLLAYRLDDDPMKFVSSDPIEVPEESRMYFYLYHMNTDKEFLGATWSVSNTSDIVLSHNGNNNTYQYKDWYIASNSNGDDARWMEVFPLKEGGSSLTVKINTNAGEQTIYVPININEGSQSATDFPIRIVEEGVTNSIPSGWESLRGHLEDAIYQEVGFEDIHVKRLSITALDAENNPCSNEQCVIRVGMNNPYGDDDRVKLFIDKGQDIGPEEYSFKLVNSNKEVEFTITSLYDNLFFATDSNPWSSSEEGEGDVIKLIPLEDGDFYKSERQLEYRLAYWEYNEIKTRYLIQNTAA